MTPIIIPSIVAARWREACAAPTLQRWRSLGQMLSTMIVTGAMHAPGSPMVDDLRTLAMVAHQHMLDLQPVRDEVAA